MAWVGSGEDFLDGVSTNALRRAFVAQTNVRAKTRLHAALMRRNGVKVESIAQEFGTTKSAVSKWLNRIHANGIQAAMPIKQTGRPKRLSTKQLNTLKRDLLKDPTKQGFDITFWDTRLVQEHVKRKFHASFVERHMRRLLHLLGFSLKKPRPQDHRANKADQARFKKNSLVWYPNV